MLSQKNVRVESLDLIKSKYNRNEKCLWGFTKLRMWLAALAQIPVIVTIFVPETDFYFVTMT